MSINWDEINQKLRDITRMKTAVEKGLSGVRPEVEALRRRLSTLEDSLVEFERQDAELTREQEKILSMIRREHNGGDW